MCGIAGIISTTKAPIAPETLKRMTDVIAHRGPDGEGQWLNAERTVALGHRRLSIIDLSNAGEQPMHYMDRYVIVFNGEIYNYIELRERCLRQGYQFHSATDTEVIMALYDWKGPQALSEMDGMFAFALWDAQRGELFCARDRFGEKPFYYATDTEGRLHFGSEMKTIWAAGIPKLVDNTMVYNYIVNSLIDHPGDKGATYFSNIRKLPAAHFMLIRPGAGDSTPQRYWDIDIRQQESDVTPTEAAARIRELITTSVMRRLRSDVPIGSSLSGGLDSSVIVCTIDKLNTDQAIRQQTFSAQFPNYVKDESRYQQLIIDRCRATPHFVQPTAASMLADLKKIIYHHEEPFQHASMVAQYEVYKLAAQHGVTVLLDGQGADEVSAGYHYYYESFFRGLRARNPQLAREEEQAYYTLMADNAINIQHRKDWKYYLRKAVPAGAYEALVRLKQQTTGSEAALSKAFVREWGQTHRRITTHPDLQHALYYESMCSGLENLLRYADRNSMAHSREVRLPFLSHELVEMLFCLPEEYKIRQGWTKWVVRAAFDDLLPQQITWRKDKVGYEPPQNEWLRAPAFQAEVQRAITTLKDAGVLAADANPKRFDAYLQWKLFMTAHSLYLQ